MSPFGIDRSASKEGVASTGLAGQGFQAFAVIVDMTIARKD